MARSTRALILGIQPDLLEQADPANRLISFGVGTRMADTVCTISPLKSGVNLGFYRGVELPDPAGLLVGNGRARRHVRLNAQTDLDRPGLRELIRAAIAAKAAN